MSAQMRHPKLVRDRVPDLIRSRGEVAETTVLSVGDYTTALLDKLVEEAVELRIAAPGQHIEELADVWEVLTTAAEQLGFTMEEVEQAATFKRIVRGGFGERLWLETATAAPASRSTADTATAAPASRAPANAATTANAAAAR